MVFTAAPTYSSTYNFNPSVGDIIITAFQRIGIRPAGILQQHLQQAVIELNLLQAKLSNQQPNLWDVDLQSVVLVQATATYSVPAETVMITNAYIRCQMAGVPIPYSIIVSARYRMRLCPMGSRWRFPTAGWMP